MGIIKLKTVEIKGKASNNYLDTFSRITTRKNRQQYRQDEKDGGGNPLPSYHDAMTLLYILYTFQSFKCNCYRLFIIMFQADSDITIVNTVIKRIKAVINFNTINIKVIKKSIDLS